MAHAAGGIDDGEHRQAGALGISQARLCGLDDMRQRQAQPPQRLVQPTALPAVQVPCLVAQQQRFVRVAALAPEHEADEPVQVIGVRAGVPGVYPPFDHIEQHVQQQVLLAGDMVVKAAGQQPDPAGQLAHAHGDVAGLRHQLCCRLQQGCRALSQRFSHRWGLPRVPPVQAAAARQNSGACLYRGHVSQSACSSSARARRITGASTICPSRVNTPAPLSAWATTRRAQSSSASAGLSAA